MQRGFIGLLVFGLCLAFALYDEPKRNLYKRVTDLMECDSSKAALGLKQYPIHGFVLGDILKKFICLPVEIFEDGKSMGLKDVVFMIETDNYEVLLSRRTLNAMGLTAFSKSMISKVNGIRTEILLKEEGDEINYLGARYFDFNKLTVFTDYANRNVVVEEGHQIRNIEL